MAKEPNHPVATIPGLPFAYSLAIVSNTQLRLQIDRLSWENKRPVCNSSGLKPGEVKRYFCRY